MLSSSKIQRSPIRSQIGIVFSGADSFTTDNLDCGGMLNMFENCKINNVKFLASSVRNLNSFMTTQFEVPLIAILHGDDD